jgi:hypothetical protein
MHTADVEIAKSKRTDFAAGTIAVVMYRIHSTLQM